MNWNTVCIKRRMVSVKAIFARGIRGLTLYITNIFIFLLLLSGELFLNFMEQLLQMLLK